MTLELCASLLIYPSGIPDDTRAVCESVDLSLRYP